MRRALIAAISLGLVAGARGKAVEQGPHVLRRVALAVDEQAAEKLGGGHPRGPRPVCHLPAQRGVRPVERARCVWVGLRVAVEDGAD